jgi:hypothetical protein
MGRWQVDLSQVGTGKWGLANGDWQLVDWQMDRWQVGGETQLIKIYMCFFFLPIIYIYFLSIIYS